MARTSKGRHRRWACQLQVEYVWWRVSQGLPVGVVPIGGLLVPFRQELEPLQRLVEWLGEK